MDELFPSQTVRKTTIQQLLQFYSIPYNTKGRNIANGWVGMKCPVCKQNTGTEDPSMHFCINIGECYFNCLRCKEHGNWTKLNQLLKNTIEYYDYELKPQSQFISDVQQPPIKSYLIKPYYLYNEHNQQRRKLFQYTTQQPTDIQDEFRSRGFARKLIEFINPCIGEGELKDYIIYKEDANFIGRKMNNNNPKAPKWHTQKVTTPLLFGLKYVRRVQPEKVFVCEGIFDMLSLPLGHSVAVLTNSLSMVQLNVLIEKNPRLNEIMFCFDRGTQVSNKVLQILKDVNLKASFINWEQIPVDWGKDIDELRINQPEYYTRLLSELL